MHNPHICRTRLVDRLRKLPKQQAGPPWTHQAKSTACLRCSLEPWTCAVVGGRCACLAFGRWCRTTAGDDADESRAGRLDAPADEAPAADAGAVAACWPFCGASFAARARKRHRRGGATSPWTACCHSSKPYLGSTGRRHARAQAPDPAAGEPAHTRHGDARWMRKTASPSAR